MPSKRPFIVGIGGTTKPNSSTECALRIALEAARRAGAEVALFDGEKLAALPLYRPELRERTPEEMDLLTAVRRADGLILASPGYHGGVSALVKNAIDLLEETARDSRCYLDGLAVGLIATAYGWQATGATLTALRSIVHALRGWPTPLGVAVNSSGGGLFTPDGGCTDDAVSQQLDMVGRQVVDFACRPAGVHV